MRYPNGTIDDEPLVAMRRAVGQPDTRRWHLKIICEQADYSLVRLPVHRRGRRPNPQLCIANAKDFVATCPRLDSDLQNEIAAIPAGSTIIAGAQIGYGRRVTMYIATACNAMIANIGEMSSPPMGRIRLRNGLITGSTSIAMKAVAGL